MKKKWSRTMQIIIAIIIALLFAALCYGTFKWKNKIIQDTYKEMQEKNNSYTFIYEGKEWGPEITGMILYADHTINQFTEKDLAPELFTVTVTSDSASSNSQTFTAGRKVKAAQFCDVDGNPIQKEEDTNHILLSFDTEEYSGQFSPFVTENGTAKWKSNYSYVIKHPKFNGNILITNDPIVTESALEKIKELGLKY